MRSVRRVALLRDSVGYLDLTVFSGETAAEVRQGVDSLRALGARSLILDMRGNLAGLRAGEQGSRGGACHRFSSSGRWKAGGRALRNGVRGEG